MKKTPYYDRKQEQVNEQELAMFFTKNEGAVAHGGPDQEESPKQSLTCWCETFHQRIDQQDILIC